MNEGPHRDVPSHLEPLDAGAPHAVRRLPSAAAVPPPHRQAERPRLSTKYPCVKSYLASASVYVQILPPPLVNFTEPSQATATVHPATFAHRCSMYLAFASLLVRVRTPVAGSPLVLEVFALTLSFATLSFASFVTAFA